MNRQDIIYRALSGGATQSEQAELDAWIARSEANREEYEDLKLLWEVSRGLSADTDADEGGDEAFGRIAKAVKARFRRKKRRRRAGRVGIALAGFVAALTLAVYAAKESRPSVLEFRDASVQSVLHVIEREYGVEVRAEDDALLACRFTGTFYRMDRPDDVLRHLSNAIKADIETAAPGRYRLKGSGC